MKRSEDGENDIILCSGSRIRIPFYDPVPNMDMHFGYEKKKPEEMSMDQQQEPDQLQQQASELGQRPDDNGWPDDDPVYLVPVHQPLTLLLSPPLSPVRAQKRKQLHDDRVPRTLVYVFNECLVEGVKLKLQNMGKGRRSVNRSFFDMAKKRICWTVEFVFEADGIFFKYLRHNVDEDLTIESALRELTSGGFELPNSLSRFNKCGLSDVRMYHVSGVGFMDVTSDMTLKQANIFSVSVLEFPTIVITPKDYGAVIKYSIDAEEK